MSLSQNALILRHLKTGRAISPLQALDKFGIMRLGARIYDLKRSGVKIEVHMVKAGKKRWASYLLGA